MSPGSSTKGGNAAGIPWKMVALLSLAGNLVFLVSGGLSGGGGEAAEVDRLVDEYFRVWSAQDMEGYRNCFHPAAVVYFVDANGVPRPSGLGPFVESQRQVHANSKKPMREIPLEKQTRTDDRVARSRVTWKLFNDGGEETGVDYFTFVKTKNGWKIVSLLFYKDS